MNLNTLIVVEYYKILYKIYFKFLYRKASMAVAKAYEIKKKSTSISLHSPLKQCATRNDDEKWQHGSLGPNPSIKCRRNVIH
jgi:hypothetical protein